MKKFTTKLSVVLINLLLLSVLLILVDFFVSKIKKPEEEALILPIRYVQMRENSLPNSRRCDEQSEYYRATSDNLQNETACVDIDSFGFIKSKIHHDNADYNIVFLGGSTTECIFIDDSLRFPNLVGELFNRQNKRVNTFNSGVSRNSSMNSLNILINKIIHNDFHVAVMMHNINDYTLLMFYQKYYFEEDGNSRANIIRIYTPMDQYRIDLETRGLGFKIRMALQSLYPHLYVKIHDIYRRSLVPNRPHFDFEGMKLKPLGKKQIEYFHNNIKTFIVVCKANGIQPVLMTQFNRIVPEEFINNPVFTYHKQRLDESDMSVEEYCRGYRTLNEVIREVASQEKVLLIDLDKEVPKTKQYLADIIHLTNEGSAMVANIIFSKLDSVLYGNQAQ